MDHLMTVTKSGNGLRLALTTDCMRIGNLASLSCLLKAVFHPKWHFSPFQQKYIRHFHQSSIDDYAKDGGTGEVWLLCSFYHEHLHNWIKTNVNKFGISNNTALKLAIQALRSYLYQICKYELHSLSSTNVSAAKDHDENCIKIRPPLVRYL